MGKPSRPFQNQLSASGRLFFDRPSIFETTSFANYPPKFLTQSIPKTMTLLHRLGLGGKLANLGSSRAKAAMSFPGYRAAWPAAWGENAFKDEQNKLNDKFLGL
jgi:hypothetical protein